MLMHPLPCHGYKLIMMKQLEKPHDSLTRTKIHNIIYIYVFTHAEWMCNIIQKWSCHNRNAILTRPHHERNSPVMTDNSLPYSGKDAEELMRLYGKYRGLRAVLLTRVSSPGQEHAAQERVVRRKLIEPLGLLLDEERHLIHDTYTGLEYRYREALDTILRM